jgi:hypothetical protein
MVLPKKAYFEQSWKLPQIEDVDDANMRTEPRHRRRDPASVLAGVVVTSVAVLLGAFIGRPTDSPTPLGADR